MEIPTTIMTTEFQQGIEEAKKRGRKIDLRALRQKADQEFFTADMRRAAAEMLGDRFKVCTFDNYDTNANNREAYAACKQLCDSYAKGMNGILLTGPNGIGKNHLAAAIVNSLAEKIIPCYFGSITKIKTKICDAFGSGVEDAIDTIMRYNVVCINDLGAERDTDFAQELLFDLVDRMYEDKHTLIVTTNLDDQALFKRYGSRIVSRIIGMCDVICFEDYDHRL